MNTLDSVEDWHPSGIYIWNKKQITKWIDTYGRYCFYNGKRYSIKPKKIFGDRYEVKFFDIDVKQTRND